ncbi:MAG TPA: hypothetical protein VK705_07235 [Ferruginibacter sp.]|jgi:hypothetical protein|nr:hypothetical protein [Ferruginibacter sp.]
MNNLKYKSQGNVVSIIFIIAFIAFIFLDVLKGTKSFFVNFDNVQQFYAWYQKLNYSLHHGYLPLWDANTFGGKNFAGEFQTGIFYPINILWIFLFGNNETINVYYLDLLVLFHFCIAAVGIYFICRQWKISYLASILGGLLFAATGCLIGRANGQTAIFFGLTLLPYSFLFAIKYLDTKNKINLLLIGFFLGMQILAGHIQPFFHTALLTFSYIAYVIFSRNISFINKRKEFAIVCLIIISVTVVVSSPQLYTGFKYMGHAYRWVSAENPVSPGGKVPFKTYSERFSLTPTQFFNIIDRRDFPVDDGNDLFIGLIPVLLILIIIYTSFRKKIFSTFDENKKIFYWIMLVSIVIMLGQYTYLPYILYELPFVNTIRELGRYVILLHFCNAILMAFGFEYVLSKSYNFTPFKKKILITILAIGFLEIIYLLLVHPSLIPTEIIWHLFFLAIIFAFIIFLRNNSLIKYAAFICVLLAIKISSGYSINAVDSSSYPPAFFKKNKIIEYLEPKYGDGRVLLESDKIPENIGDVYKIQTKMGHSATMNKPYFDFIAQDWNRNSEVNDLLNIKYVISKDSINLPLIMRDDNLQLNLYERPTAYSRLFLKSATNKTIKNTPTAFTYTKICYSDLYQKYEVNVASSDTLVFSENYYDGWKIFLDSKRVDILQPSINNELPLLMGIKIPEGKHIVELKYNCFIP